MSENIPPPSRHRYASKTTSDTRSPLTPRRTTHLRTKSTAVLAAGNLPRNGHNSPLKSNRGSPLLKRQDREAGGGSGTAADHAGDKKLAGNAHPSSGSEPGTIKPVARNLIAGARSTHHAMIHQVGIRASSFTRPIPPPHVSCTPSTSKTLPASIGHWPLCRDERIIRLMQEHTGDVPEGPTSILGVSTSSEELAGEVSEVERQIAQNDSVYSKELDRYQQADIAVTERERQLELTNGDMAGGVGGIEAPGVLAAVFPSKNPHALAPNPITRSQTSIPPLKVIGHLSSPSPSTSAQCPPTSDHVRGVNVSQQQDNQVRTGAVAAKQQLSEGVAYEEPKLWIEIAALRSELLTKDNQITSLFGAKSQQDTRILDLQERLVQERACRRSMEIERHDARAESRKLKRELRRQNLFHASQIELMDKAVANEVRVREQMRLEYEEERAGRDEDMRKTVEMLVDAKLPFSGRDPHGDETKTSRKRRADQDSQLEEETTGGAFSSPSKRARQR